MPPLHISAYLLETRHLSTREHGAYLLLLIKYWLQGPLCDDDAELASVVKLDHKSWREIRSSIRRLFTIGKDGRLHHERSDLERIKADKITTMRRNAAEQRWSKDEHVAEHEPLHGASEQENPDQLHANAYSLHAEPHAAPSQPGKAGESPSPEHWITSLPSPLREAVAAYQEVAKDCGLAQVRSLNAKRQKALAERIEDIWGLEGWLLAMDTLRVSGYALGKGANGWKISFDSLITQRIFVRLVENGYLLRDDETGARLGERWDAFMHRPLKVTS